MMSMQLREPWLPFLRAGEPGSYDADKSKLSKPPSADGHIRPTHLRQSKPLRVRPVQRESFRKTASGVGLEEYGATSENPI